ncbi:TniQ family protein [Pseudomonas sp. JDS28PS106]|uniref:TniQ family protein n=1 Tax=Pseudomonas sp. JDS28PS106 TaxID=2497235 RepID=UPI002FD05B92
MLLKIQPDESLTSYVRRSFFVNWSMNQAEILEDLATYYAIRTENVRRLAKALGWAGCYGFNRLIHSHTLMAATYVIKSDWDISYSGKQYVSLNESFSSRAVSYCPDCIRENFQRLGFAYWSRFTSPHVTVCYKHNVELLSRCPFCDRPFTVLGHGPEVMWRKCRGRHLAEACSVPNEDLLALRRAKVYQRLCTSPHHIPDEQAVSVLRRKASSAALLYEGDAKSLIESQAESLSTLAQILESERLIRQARIVRTAATVIIDAITTLYESYDDFAQDLKSLVGEGRPTNALWNTYQAGGVESAHFVEEDYALGTGKWSSPLPSPLSSMEKRHDDFHRFRVNIYSCCNFSLIKGKEKKQSHPNFNALPEIPRQS